VTLSLVPQPREVQGHQGLLTLTSPLRVSYDDEWSEVVDVFAADVSASVGWEVHRVAAGEVTDIQLVYDATRAAEGYTVHVGDQVVLGASSEAGFSYALTTLRQMGPAQLWSARTTTLESWTIEGVSIIDGPAFGWRGAHLDVVRHFFGVDVVLRFIDLLAAHRLNRLHLHLNDDQGWRVDVPAWPRLTEIGSMRSGSPVGHESEDRRDDVPHGGYYSAGDVAEILDHARRRHVEVIPEIDLPGHAQAVLAAYPQFGNTVDRLQVWNNWGISQYVLNVEDATLDFAEDVVRYVAGLFPGSPVHIGGDECPTTQWEASDAARTVMQRHGFDHASQLQGLYTRRLAEVLQREGHEVLAWDEVLDAEVPEGTTICAWRSVDQGVHAAQLGLDVVMAPMQYLYFDWLSSDSLDEPVAVAPVPCVTTWEKVYGFEVIPDGLDPTLTHHVRGAQVQLWTEYIDSTERLDYMAFPRLCAFSEVLWGTGGDVDAFRARLRRHLERLDALGVAYRRLDPATSA
jgi:hexosaminidase